MAAAKSQKSDLLQIVMLTLFLCAVFFTGWGIFSNIKVGRLLEERRHEVANIKNLEKELKEPGSIQALRDFRAREESKKNTQQIDSAVTEVFKKSRLTLDRATPSPPKTTGSGSSRIHEHTYRVYANPASIDDVYTFLARLEADAPHLDFRSIRVSTKKKKVDDPDLWDLDLTLVMYTTDQ